jgi:hypothetical protein
MADNVNVSEGSGKVIRTDEVGGVQVQVIKPAFGVDGAATLVSATDPLPVAISASVGVTGPLTDTQLRASAVPVSGTVTASGPLTDTQLRATAVPVSDGGATLSIDDGAGSITVDGNVTANPTVVAMTTVTNTTATAGDNTIIAAPGSGNRIVVYSLQIQLEAATATTVLKKSGSTTIGRLYCAAAGDGAIWVYPAGRELRLGTAEAFVINLSGANAIGYTVRYSTEAV